MTNKELIINVLKEHSCLTANEIKGFILRQEGPNLSPQSIAGIMRPIIAAGHATKGVSPSNNKTVYWLTRQGEAYYFG